MKSILMAVVSMALVSGAGQAQTTTKQQNQQHELACVAGTVTGALLGAAVGGKFGNGTGRTLMQVAGAGAGAKAGSNLTCK